MPKTSINLPDKILYSKQVRIERIEAAIAQLNNEFNEVCPSCPEFNQAMINLMQFDFWAHKSIEFNSF